MTVQPTYHWQFNEREGSVTRDAIKGVEAKLVRCSLQLHGRIGNAIQLNGKDSALYLGQEAGQFGTGDFTIAFGMAVLNRNDQDNLDIIGTRSFKSHGNWVSLLLINKKQLYFEVDEDANGTNFFTLTTENIINDSAWHHIALVRQKLMLRIYVDGEEVASGEAPGIANINNGSDMKVGDWVRDTPTARYEDLRIYHNIALSAEEIRSLVTPANRFLLPGEIELLAADNAAVIFNEDVTNLDDYSTEFKQIRLGANTAVRFYNKVDFDGASQKVYSNLPDIRSTHLGGFPRSVHIFSSVGEPFTGKWVISAGNGQYLSQNKHTLATAPQHSANGFFSFRYNPNTDEALLVPANNAPEMSLLNIDGKATRLIVDDSEIEKAAFSIIHPSGDKWLALSAAGSFTWTTDRLQRVILYRVAKLAADEGQVGELSEGEIALYQHFSYKGFAWVLSDYEPGITGNFMSLKGFLGLDNAISSIRVGPNTGVTLFANENQQVDEAKRETQIEDVVEDSPDIRVSSQVGNDNISSLRVFRRINADAIFTSYVSKLSEDYRMVGDELVQFSAYRTTLRFAKNDIKVEVSATDLTTIEVDGETYEIDEVRSVILQPNALNRIMITSEADGITTPGLKFRTPDMGLNEQVVIFPDEDVHKQIAELEEDALWNATDAEGQPLIDQQVHKKSDIANLQRTISLVMSTVVPPSPAASVNVVGGTSLLRSFSVVAEPVNAFDPWKLSFGDTDGGVSSEAGTEIISEQSITQDEFNELFTQKNNVPVNTETEIDGLIVINTVASLRSFKDFFSDLKDSVKNAASASLGFFNGVLQVALEIGGRVVNFVLDTAKKVATFVEALVEKVIKSIKKFVEFLRFLFNWDDIVATQKYIVKSVNSLFDTIGDIVESAKKPVTKFVDHLQDELEEGINSLIKDLGGDPDAVQTPSANGPDLPEAAEWFLNLIMGRNTPSLQTTIGNIESLVNNEFAQPFMSFIEKMETVAGVGLRAFDGLFEAAESLVTNPRHPEQALIELLQVVRDIGIYALELGEEFVIYFLDLIVDSIENFRRLLNGDIPIPFVSKLFDMIGLPKPSVLHITSMMVAIPLTVMHKLMFGTTPFKDAPLPEFPKPAGSVSQRSLAVTTDDPEPEPEVELDFSSKKNLVTSFGLLGYLSDRINQIITMVLDLMPEKTDTNGKATAIFEVSSLMLSGFSWLSSFPSSPDHPGGFPYNVVGHRLDDVEDADERDGFHWQRIVWGWRTATLSVDIVYMVLAAIPQLQDKFKLQRLRRADKYTAAFFFVITVVDVGLTWRYLTTIPRDEGRPLEITNEVFGFLPSLFCVLRLKPNKLTMAILGGAHVASAIVVPSTSMLILLDTIEGLTPEES